MKKTTAFSLALISFLSFSCRQEKDQEVRFIQEVVSQASLQTEGMLQQTGEPDGRNYPRTIDRDGRFRTTTRADWTPGFFPGSLWYLYELTGEENWKEEAEKWTVTLEPLKTFTGNHDIGFMMYCSYGNAERLASQPEYKEILVESARSLCTRFDERVQAIESWDYRKAWDDSEWFYPVIIDNMMNLELLCYASKVTGEPTYQDIAIAHANTTLKYHFRDDHSSYHVVNYDTITGQPLHRQTCQGYSDNSTWSRGQAWAVYGYTMMYRETGIPAYLEAAKNFADYYIRNLPEDRVPAWDFNVGQEGFTPQGDSYAVTVKDKVKDASASSIVCSALFELAELANESFYREEAIRMLKSLASPAYFATPGANANFLIMHCTGSLPHQAEIDVPLVYADYYFLEALTRYKRIL